MPPPIKNQMADDRPLSAKKFSAAVALTIFIVFAVSRYFEFSYVSSLGLIVTVIAIAPSVYYCLKGFKKPIPLIELHCFFYALGFGLPALSDSSFLRRPSDDLMIEALLLTLYALLFLLTGYTLGARGLRIIVRPLKFPAPTTYWELEKFGWICELAYVLGYFYSQSNLPKIGSVDQAAGLLGWVGKADLIWLFLTHRLSRVGRVVFIFGLISFESIRALTSGLLAEFLALGLVFVLVSVNLRKRLPVKAIIVILVLFIFFNPVKHDYRQVAWFSGETLGYRAAIKEFVGMAIDYWSSPTLDRLDYVTVSLTSRLDHVGLLANVMEMTPSIVPYAQGSTIFPITYYWIPRIIWPDKPEARLGNEWAKWYGFLDPWDDVTSFNLPWLVEFYLNFGIYGALICMFFTGVLFFLIEHLFSRAHYEVLPFCFGLGIALTIWYGESNFALMWGNILTKIIFILVISRIFFGKRQA